MKTCLRYGTIALTIMTGIGLAAAQVGSPGVGDPQTGAMSKPSQLTLSPAQKIVILNAVRQDSQKIAPANFQASIGGPVPPSIELYILPTNALAQAPDLKSLKYTMVQNQVVLVDPTTMRVVDILR